MKIYYSLVLFIVCVFYCNSQLTFDKVEFEHGNSMIIGSYIKISLQPIKNNKKEKVRVVFESKDYFYTKRISKEEFQKICSSIRKIKNDTIAVNSNLIDGSDTRITIFSSNKKTYFASGLSAKDEFDNNRKDFWMATKLIVEAAKMKLKNLIDYN